MAKHYYKIQNLSLFISCLFTTVLADCEAEEENSNNNRTEALKYKIGAIVSILASSLIGICIPILGKSILSLKPETNLFFVIKAFAAGVILATGFMHVLPDAFESLSKPCLNGHGPWTKFPFAGFFAMLASIITLVVDVSATSHFKKKNQVLVGEEDVAAAGGGGGAADVEIFPVTNSHSHGHCHGDFVSTNLRYRVISQVLELGIIVHSVIIGITLGASDSPKRIKPLLAALTFHQFFEGIGLGGCITQAKFRSRAVIIMALFFSLTTPVGIGIGIGISKKFNYKETDRNALIVQGILNSASAGILIYMALVDLLSADFMNPKMQNNGKLQIGANISLLLGSGFMSLLAYWA